MTRHRFFPLLTVAVLAAGCAAKTKPPLVNLWTRRELAVMALAPDPADPALAGDVRAELAAALRALDAAPVTDPARVDALPKSTAAASPWTDAAWRRSAADALGADLLLFGSVREFREAAEPEKPKRIRLQLDASWKWGVSDVATAHCAATLVLVDAATGAVVWTRDLPGDGKDARWTDLPWPGENAAPPPAGWDEMLGRLRPAIPEGALRYPGDSSAARARREAIGEIVRAVLNDFTGHDGWEPPLKSK